MVDKETILQVLCGLMRHPQYLSEKDKYSLTTADFTTYFEKYVFSAIYNLYQGGAAVITVSDIDNYFNAHEVAKSVFEKENGVEYLQDALDFTSEENFPFYYRRLKKFNAIHDLQKAGFDTSWLYCEDLTNEKAKQINDKFEELEVSDIFEMVRRRIMKLEVNYSTGDASETESASDGIVDLLEELRIRPEVGAPLQGEIFNTVSRGARKGKFYIRTCSSGVGKTRQAVGDMCYLSYPLRFNVEQWMWEYNGSNEKSLFIATEQKKDEIQTMILAYLTGFNEEKFIYNNFSDLERTVVQQAVKVMKTFEDNVFIVTLPNPSIEQIKAVVRQNWLLHNIENVFYDYIFSSPNLLNEFRDLRIREDVALGMLSTALKDLAVEMNLFVESGTQTNAKAKDEDERDEGAIRGSRAIIDKCDLGCIVSPVTQDELELLKSFIDETGLKPTHVTDIYKVRRGRYTKVKIWSELDLGTCRKNDLFITDVNYWQLPEFELMRFEFKEQDGLDLIMKMVDSLNSERGTLTTIDQFNEPQPVELINLDDIEQEKEISFESLL